MAEDRNKYRVLIYLDNASGRDTEIMLPVAYALENFFDCEITFHFIWDIYAIRRIEPDIVLLPNIKGHNLYFEIAKYAYQNDILLLATESEGIFRTDGSFPYWGYNTDEFFYQKWVTAWSERTRQYMINLKPDDADKIVLTGGTGFDRYKYFSWPERNALLSKYGKEKYKKVIGYAGWAFGKMYSKHKDIALAHINPDWDARFEWSEKNRKMVRDILEVLIKNNPDTLFLFKRHPKESFEDDLSEGPNEMNELLGYPNVLYLRREELIHNLISISDLWMGFETTTSQEAWLMNKQTMIINQQTDFPRNPLYKGSLIVGDTELLQQYIDEFYQTGTIEDFYSEKLSKNREELVKDTYGFNDGLNHLRVCYYFAKSLCKRKSKNKPKFNLRHFRLYVLMHLGKYFYNEKLFALLPGFKKSIYVFKNMNLPGFAERKKMHDQDLGKFYHKLGLEDKLNSGNWEGILGNEILSEE